MGIARTPWLGNVTLTDTNPHQLSALLADVNYVAAEYQPYFGADVPKCQYLVIKNDVINSGKLLYIGNEGLSLTFFGDRLVAAQELPIYSMESNLIRLDEIYVMTDITGLIVNVKLLTR